MRGMSWGRYRKGLRVKAEEHLGIRSVWRDAWLPTEEGRRRRDITRCAGRSGLRSAASEGRRVVVRKHGDGMRTGGMGWATLR